MAVSLRPTPTPITRRVSLSEVLGALSYALDLTEGQPPGHVLRTSAIGMRIAEMAALPAGSRSALYYALLIKDSGCSSNAARMAALFAADDQTIKRVVKEADWQNQLSLATHLWRYIAAGSSLGERVRQALTIARDSDAPREVISIRCERGADIARRLGFPEETAQAIRGLDEHWNGRGQPTGLRGDEIPILARIASLSQTIEVFSRHGGVDRALDVARHRSGRWFDPALVRIVCDLGRDAAWWAALDRPDLAERVSHLEPPDEARFVDAEGIDEVAAAFADIIDAKSPYTYHHSTRVAELARGIARVQGLGPAEERRIARAALLHDVGKLGVSNRILDKAGPLTEEERSAVERHPRYTAEILERAPVFADVVSTAATHHERLDGSGYPWQLTARELDGPGRLLCVADVYEALTSARPYRSAMPVDQALEILHRDARSKLCPAAVAALETHLRATPGA